MGREGEGERERERDIYIYMYDIQGLGFQSSGFGGWVWGCGGLHTAVPRFPAMILTRGSARDVFQASTFAHCDRGLEVAARIWRRSSS